MCAYTPEKQLHVEKMSILRYFSVAEKRYLPNPGQEATSKQ